MKVLSPVIFMPAVLWRDAQATVACAPRGVQDQRHDDDQASLVAPPSGNQRRRRGPSGVKAASVEAIRGYWRHRARDADRFGGRGYSGRRSSAESR
jgi:hypothetical protein